MKLRKVCAIALLLVMMSNIFVFAAEKREFKNLDEYVDSISEYVERNSDGTLELKVPLYLSDTTYYNEAVKGLEMTNQMIESGYLKTDADSNIIVTDKYVKHLKSQSANVNGSDIRVVAEGNTIEIIENEYSLRSSGGVNKIVWTFVGFDLYLNSSNSNKVAAGGASAAGVLAIWFPEPLVSKIIATALIVYSGAILIANSDGTGVIIRAALTLIPAPVCIIYWVKSQ